MQKHLFIPISALFAVSALAAVLVAKHPGASPPDPLTANAATLTIPFIANEGQFDQAIKFQTPFLGGEVAVTEQGEIVYSFRHLTLTERVVGGAIPSLAGEGKTPTKVNYFVGNDATKWRRNIASYESVAFGEVYPGIDLKLTAHGGNMEKIFTVTPGAHAQDIQLAVDGAKALRVDAGGRLEVDTNEGPVRFTKPVAYQDVDGERQNIQVAYAVFDDRYGFALGDYDRSRPVVIDPLLSSTFINGPSFNHWGMDFAPDGSGIYLAGDRGVPPGFSDPDTEIPMDPKTDLNTYVAKLSVNLSALEAYTVIGSPNYADVAGVMAVNGSRKDFSVYVAGRTYGDDFPVTAGAFDTTHNSTTATVTADGYVAKFTPDLQLVAASFIGGGEEETQSHWLDFDDDGNVYFGGKTHSLDFPTHAAAFDRSYNGGTWDAYVAKMSPDLSSLLAATYYGGSLCDVTRNGRLDGDGNLFFTGQTISPDAPMTEGAYDTVHDGDRDFYVAKMDSDFTQLLASTYVGTAGTDFPSYLRIDNYGYVNIVGYTQSPDFPVSAGSYDTTHAGIFDGVVVRLDPDLTRLVRSTFFGGSDVDLGFTFDMDKSGNIYITGRTRSQDYPTTPGAYDTDWNGDYDTMLTVLDYDLNQLLYSTYIGGANLDMAFSVRWDVDHVVYLAGVSGSPDFPTTDNAYDRTHVPLNTAFALKINAAPPDK